MAASPALAKRLTSTSTRRVPSVAATRWHSIGCELHATIRIAVIPDDAADGNPPRGAHDAARHGTVHSGNAAAVCPLRRSPAANHGAFTSGYR